MTVTKQIPKQLIYEMDNGQPIYYSGYQDYLSGLKPIEALKGSGILQSLIISELLFYVRSVVGNQYFVLTNELGVHFLKGNWRKADIAIIEKNRIKTINDKYNLCHPM